MTRLADLNITAGPGDPETWGPPTGHPLDPRTSDEREQCERCDGEGMTVAGYLPSGDADMDVCDDCDGDGVVELEPLEDPRIDADELEGRR